MCHSAYPGKVNRREVHVIETCRIAPKQDTEWYGVNQQFCWESELFLESHRENNGAYTSKCRGSYKNDDKDNHLLIYHYLSIHVTNIKQPTAVYFCYSNINK